MDVDLSIIIVNYKSSDVLKQCLDSIIKSNITISYDIIVVDSNSNDEGLPSIKSQYPMAKYIDLPLNNGFAAACNVGIKASRGEIILLLNPDTVLRSDTVQGLYNYLSTNPHIGIVGPMILSGDGTIQNKVIPKEFPNLWRVFCWLTGLDNLFSKHKLFNSYFGHDFNYEMVQEVKQVNGCCFMIRKEVLNKIGLLDERYFLYFEETDLCFSSLKHGYKIVYYPLSTITHLEGTSASTLKKKSVESYYKGLIYFFKKNYGVLNALILWILLTFLLAMRLCLFFLIIYHHKNTNRAKENLTALLLCLNLKGICLLLKNSNQSQST